MTAGGRGRSTVGLALLMAGAVALVAALAGIAAAAPPSLPPSPTLSPGPAPGTPVVATPPPTPLTLTDAQSKSARDILSASYVLKGLVGAQTASVLQVAPWADGQTGRLTGVALQVSWPNAVHLDAGLPQPVPTPGSPGYIDGVNDVAFDNVSIAWIFIDLARHAVVGVKPDPLLNRPTLLPTSNVVTVNG